MSPLITGLIEKKFQSEMLWIFSAKTVICEKIAPLMLSLIKVCLELVADSHSLIKPTHKENT